MKLEVIFQEPESMAHSTPILFVHGMWQAAWCWTEKFLPYFAQHGYPTYALSLRGHGASQGREWLRWASLADYVEDVSQVVNEMERPPVLVGHSMGGMIVQKYLESHRLPAAVLLASAPPRGLIAATLRTLCRHPTVSLKVPLKLSLYPLIGNPSLCREMLFSEDMGEQELKAYYARMQDESFRVYLDMLLLDLPRPKQVKTPLLVLGMEHDKAVSKAEVNATAQAYGVRAEIFEGMVHAVMLEAGWQNIADRIIRWLGEQGL